MYVCAIAQVFDKPFTIIPRKNKLSIACKKKKVKHNNFYNKIQHYLISRVSQTLVSITPYGVCNPQFIVAYHQLNMFDIIKPQKNTRYCVMRYKGGCRP